MPQFEPEYRDLQLDYSNLDFLNGTNPATFCFFRSFHTTNIAQI